MLRSGALPNQLWQRPMVADQVLRAAIEVGELRMCDVNPQPFIKRGEYVAKVNWPRLGLFAPPRGRAQDLAATHSATGHQGTTNVGPMVAAGVGIDLRRATKLAPCDNGNVVNQ